MNTARTPFVVASCYLALVLALWLPFNPQSGLPYETGFVYTSEISTWWNGFVHGADHLRFYTSLFYQVAYLMGDLSGFAGSFVPYQITYAALWWARGFLLFLIGRRLAPGHDLFWYQAGAFVLVHSSDSATGWAGLLNQSGYTFWMPLAFYALVIAFQQSERRRADIALVLSIFFEHLSLWSYESQLLIILIAPLLLLRMYPRPWRSPLAIAAAWYVLPVIYIAATIRKYARSAGHTYQESVLRKVWSAGSILSDWLFNISASLSFWNWPRPEPAYASTSQMAPPAMLAVFVFLVGIGLLVWTSRSWVSNRRTLWTVMLTGLLLLALSFPAYLILESARSLWRTQILSGFGAALVLAAAIGLAASYAQRNWIRFSAVALLGGLVVGYGSFSAVKKSAFHRWVWERQRSAMAQVLSLAPRLKDGTLVILTDVPKDDDPFLGDEMWFDMALRLAYPGTRLVGIYFYQDGSPALGKAAMGRADTMLVLDYQPQGRLSVARSLPSFLRVEGTYNPEARMESGSPSPRAVRRYRSNVDLLFAPR
ncbi:MAG TPA: hypothetical protein VGP62_05510 [Bryobacteraceae bacterium]|nr:hypothetical protein [Bryobacteraceae bacterium]